MPKIIIALVTLSLICGALLSLSHGCETYCGLAVQAEDRCSGYDKRRDYPYPASIEWDIVERAGYQADTEGVLDRPFPSPYVSGVAFTRIKGQGGTDIEHIVATSEAHDSGLCAASLGTRRQFATDLDNLTLASPRVNRHQKSGKDAAEWLPEINRRAYAETVIRVKRKYGLSVDAAERDALQNILGTACPDS